MGTIKEITDEYMREMMSRTRNYCVVILKATSKRNEPGVERIIREHGRRNFALREEGLLSIVCPVTDDGDVRGIGIFNASVEETRRLMDDDPGVKAGVFEYEAHAAKSFPGDCLPK